MRAAALTAAKRRGNANTHALVLGHHRLTAGVITLWAVAQGHALDILRPIQMTDKPQHMYRWRTVQAASQFRDRHEIADAHVINLHWLDVLPPNNKDPK